MLQAHLVSAEKVLKYAELMVLESGCPSMAKNRFTYFGVPGLWGQTGTGRGVTGGPTWGVCAVVPAGAWEASLASLDTKSWLLKE